MLVLQAGDEIFVDNQAMSKFFTKIRSDNEYKYEYMYIYIYIYIYIHVHFSNINGCIDMYIYAWLYAYKPNICLIFSNPKP
jgi:hypothetical protein